MKTSSDNFITALSTISTLQTNNAYSNKVADNNLTVHEQAKKLQNLMILDDSSHVIHAHSNNKSISQKPMELLYKTAIEAINKYLAPVRGEEDTTNTYKSDLDVSPEATAQRIIQGSTAFYEAFKEQHNELGEEEALTEFISIINSGINTGFTDAKNLLDTLSVLEGDIKTNIEATYDLVLKGINDFEQKVLASFTKNELNKESNTPE